MATLYINKVSSTVENCLAYGAKDKVEFDVGDNISDVINYERNDKTGAVTFRTLTSTLNCPNMGEDTIKDFQEIINRNLMVNRSGRRNITDKKPALAFHLTQSFEEGTVTPLKAHNIGIETAKRLFGDNYLVQISTHTNTENIHNHIIFSAWGNNGKKWHDCNESMRSMRKVSDTICQEHALSILEDTKDYKLAKWKDKNGKIHYYEPTERKNRLIGERTGQNVAKVNDYRTTTAYEKRQNIIDDKRAIVRSDIDMCVLDATSYERLLELLQYRYGYEIKKYKKDGDWLTHISFKPPFAEKYIRDSSLDNLGMYTREVLERRIDQEQKTDNRVVQLEPVRYKDGYKNIPVINSTYYLDIDVSKLDDDVRVIRNTYTREYEYYHRGEVDSLVVQRVKNLDFKLRKMLEISYDSTEIDKIIKQQYLKRNMSKEALKAQKEWEVQHSLRQIQESLYLLRFLEQNTLSNYHEINRYMDRIQIKNDDISKELDKAKSNLKQMKNILALPRRLSKLTVKMEENKNDTEYMNLEYKKDKQKAENIEIMIERCYPKTHDEKRKLYARQKDFEMQFERLQQLQVDSIRRLEEFKSFSKILILCNVNESNKQMDEVKEENRMHKKYVCDPIIKEKRNKTRSRER